jgi:DNA-binding protein HU-beta
MNKAELVSIVAEKSPETKKVTEEIINLFLDEIQATLKTGEKVVLSGFGTFEVRDRAARSGLNPRNGEVISIPGQKSPAFKAGKLLKEAVK